MNLSIREMFNKSLDGLICPEILVMGRLLPAFQVCGITGFGLGILLAMILVMYLGLSPLVITGLAAVAVITFLGLAMTTKIMTGEEIIIYYHHEIAVMMMSVLFLWLTHQPILPYLDITILGIGTFLFCGRIGCLMVGCCHGRPYHWGVCYRPEHAEAGFPSYLVGVRLFPIQAVESLWVFFIVIIGITFILRGWPPSIALALYIIAYDTGRFCFELLRGDADRPYMLGFSQPQWISILLMCFVVWMEIAGVLLFQWWHLVATAGLMLAMIVITIKRRFQKSARYELLHPRHIREVAESLRLVNSMIDKTQDMSRWRLFPKPNNRVVLHLACTSLGVKISAGRVRHANGDLHHYSFSYMNGGMTEETARILADLVLQLQHPNDKGKLLNGNGQVFHLLIHPSSVKEAAW